MPLLMHNQVLEIVCGPSFPEAFNYVLNEFRMEFWICGLFKGLLGTRVVEQPKSRLLGHK